MSRLEQLKFEAELRRAELIAANGWEPNDPEPVQQIAVDLAEECWPQQKYWFFNSNSAFSDPAATSCLTIDKIDKMMKALFQRDINAQLYGSAVPFIDRIKGTTFRVTGIQSSLETEVDPKHGRYVKLGLTFDELMKKHIEAHKQLGVIDDY